MGPADEYRGLTAEGAEARREGVEFLSVHFLCVTLRPLRLILLQFDDASSFRTCLASMSASMLTRSPTPSRPRVVTARVCGMSMMEKPSAPTSTSVRLTP